VYSRVSPALRRELALLKMKMVGLTEDAADKYPSELSGGMRKRAALARAIILDPSLLFLDEPTAGLDPIAAAEFDALISYLQQHLNLTVIMITHDLDTLFRICDRVAVLVDRSLIVGTLDELLAHPHPWIQEYVHGPRARAAQANGVSRVEGKTFLRRRSFHPAGHRSRWLLRHLARPLPGA